MRRRTMIGAALLALFCAHGAAARASKNPADVFGLIHALESAMPFTKESVEAWSALKPDSPGATDYVGRYDLPDATTVAIDLRIREGGAFLVLDIDGRCMNRGDVERDLGALRPFDVSVAHGRNGPRGGLLVSWFAQRPWGKIVVWFTDEKEDCLKGVAFHVGAR